MRGRSLVRAARRRNRLRAWCGPNRGKRREGQAWASFGSWLAAAGPVAWAAGLGFLGRDLGQKWALSPIKIVKNDK